MGESGTGKKLIAKSIHDLSVSNRKLDCAVSVVLYYSKSYV